MRPQRRQARPASTRHRYRAGHGLGRIKNGELLKLVAAEFDVFITSDQNLRHQQNLSKFDLAIIVLPSNQVPTVKTLLNDLDDALDRIATGDLIEL